MGITSRVGDHRGAVSAVVTAVLLLTGGALVAQATRAPDPPPQPSAAPSSSTAAAATGAPASPSSSTRAAASPAAVPSPSVLTSQAPVDFGPLMGASEPVALRIPAIGVNTAGLIDLHLDAKGRLEAPRDFDRAGWYSEGPTPGELGPSVIGGHVDSKSGPAVFYRLGALRKGDTVEVVRADKSVARFVIDKVGRYAKADFPTAAVYGNTTDRAELRLITCGGAFDRSTGHYVDNIVVFGHLTGP